LGGFGAVRRLTLGGTVEKTNAVVRTTLGLCTTTFVSSTNNC
jgi:hypothetical protein